jgi:hypothetical protein
VKNARRIKGYRLKVKEVSRSWQLSQRKIEKMKEWRFEN